MDRKKVVEADIEARSSLRPVELSYRLIRPDGEVRYVRSIVEEIKDYRGIAVRTLGALQDITEQVKAAELLRENDERLKNAERLAHVGSWRWDLKSNKVSWSEEMFHIFGQPPTYEPSYEDILQAVLPQDRDRVERAVEACD
jgi:PAS domain-containing protein